MQHRRLILTIVALAAVLLAVPLATALGDDGNEAASAGGGVSASAALGDAITYQGRLKVGSSLSDGPHDFRFVLYDAEVGGAQVPSTPILTPSGVIVSAGLFTVSLDFGATAFNGDGRWLEIAVRQGGAGAYTTLSPRQAITANPYAFFAKKAGVATALTLPFSGSGSSATELFAATNTENVTAGTSAITGRNDSTKAGASGVLGVVTTTTPGALSAGVTGRNLGVGGTGVVGESTGGTGVLGKSGTSTGVHGESDTGVGVEGGATAGTGGSFRGDVSVQLDGAIKVLGAKPPAFIHEVAGGDGCPAGMTLINNTLTNNNPNAIILVTPTRQEAADPTHPGPVGVYYDTTAADECAVAGEHWLIVSLDGTPMVVGEKFNVLVITQVVP